MVVGLINANPVVYEKKERRPRGIAAVTDEYAEEPIDQLEIFGTLFSIANYLLYLIYLVASEIIAWIS